MQMLDFYPCQAWFSPGEPARLTLSLEVETGGLLETKLTITHLEQIASTVVSRHAVRPGVNRIELRWQPPADAPAGYGAAIQVNGGKEPLWTAFDVLPSWSAFPRYGFVCDFATGRNDAAATLEQLLPYHINGLQFYDWQYRHDCLLPPGDEYLDPLGRALSLNTVRTLIEAAQARKMAALPYLAIYAAAADFWREHGEWALYDRSGSPIPFGDNFLGLMDPSAGRPWADHLLQACATALAGLPFDGLHIDQYGEPHEAWDVSGAPVDLPRAFTDFISAARERFPGKAVLFNAVGNWPIDSLAEAALDFLYIEVWPPEVAYADLVEIALNARRLSGHKPVVIALYLPASQPANNLLADALLLACGAGRIELGEDARLLADPYFPKHQFLDAALKLALRQLVDFYVRFGEWLGPAIPGSDHQGVEKQDEIWCFRRVGAGQHTIVMVNLSGLGSNPRWDEAHPMPARVNNPAFRFQLGRPARRVLWFCPEEPQRLPQSLEFSYQNGWLEFCLPQISLLAGVTIDE